MSFDQLLLAGVAIGLGLVGLTFFVGRRDRSDRAASDTLSPPETFTPAPEPPPAVDPSPAPEVEQDDPVARLSETVAALKRLAALKEEEVERDTAVREEIKTAVREEIQTAVREEVETGWRPISNLETAWAPTAPVAPEDLSEPGPSPQAPLQPSVSEASPVRRRSPVRMQPDSATKLRLTVGQAFSPAAPISRRDLFAGREQQLETLIDVVFERGQHAVVYGERGVGKTSLATILALVFAEEQTRLPLRVNCDASDSYDSLWRKVVEEFEIAIEGLERDFPNGRAAITRAQGKNQLGPHDATRFLKQAAADIECVVLIDEFDSMSDAQAPRLFADTIKMLSDQLVPATLIVLGVADTLDELLAEHGSVHRALVHVHMPRMSVDELKEIVTRGLDLLTMDVENEVADLIAYLSQGFPHFTHVLAQAAARSAIDEQRPLVTMEDILFATLTVSDRTESWIRDAYEKATASAHDSIYSHVLLASALAVNDDRGYFAPADVRAPMTGIMGRPYEIPSFIRQLNALADDDRGPVLLRTGTERKHRYRFVEPQMEPYVIMRSIGEGLIDLNALRQLAHTGNGTSA